jgi:hypothetical protein
MQTKTDTSTPHLSDKVGRLRMLMLWRVDAAMEETPTARSEPLWLAVRLFLQNQDKPRAEDASVITSAFA